MSIKSRAIYALRWTAVSQLFSKLVTWSITIYVIRLLEPQDYGLMAMAMVMVEFAGIFSDFGLNSALIQRQSPNDTLVAKIYGAIILSSLALFLLVQFAAEPYAAFYGHPAVADILHVTAFGILTQLPKRSCNSSTGLAPSVPVISNVSPTTSAAGIRQVRKTSGFQMKRIWCIASMNCPS